MREQVEDANARAEAADAKRAALETEVATLQQSCSTSSKLTPPFGQSHVDIAVPGGFSFSNSSTSSSPNTGAPHVSSSSAFCKASSQTCSTGNAFFARSALPSAAPMPNFASDSSANLPGGNGSAGDNDRDGGPPVPPPFEAVNLAGVTPSAAKGKESDSIALKPLPGISMFKTWRYEARKVISAASHYPAAAFAWIMCVEKANSIEELANPAPFFTLDSKLNASLTAILSGSELRRQVRVKEEVLAQKSSQLLSGRQILFEVYAYFRLNSFDRSTYDFFDLQNLKLVGQNLSRFLSDWEMVLTNMDRIPEPEYLENLLRAALEGCEVMRVPMAHHYFLCKTQPELRTYERLLALAKETVADQRQRANRDSLRQLAKAGGVAMPAKSVDAKVNVNKDVKSKPNTVSDARGKDRSVSPKKSDRFKGMPSNGCRTFWSTGTCDFPNCKYEHIQNKSHKNARPQSPGGKGAGKSKHDTSGRNATKDRSASPRRDHCVEHMVGKCSKGNNCKMWHAPDCVYFKNGRCSRGADCPYRHYGVKVMSASEKPKAKATPKFRPNAAFLALSASSIASPTQTGAVEVEIPGVENANSTFIDMSVTDHSTHDISFTLPASDTVLPGFTLDSPHIDSNVCEIMPQPANILSSCLPITNADQDGIVKACVSPACIVAKHLHDSPTGSAPDQASIVAKQLPEGSTGSKPERRKITFVQSHLPINPSRANRSSRFDLVALKHETSPSPKDYNQCKPRTYHPRDVELWTLEWSETCAKAARDKAKSLAKQLCKCKRLTLAELTSFASLASTPRGSSLSLCSSCVSVPPPSFLLALSACSDAHVPCTYECGKGMKRFVRTYKKGERAVLLDTGATHHVTSVIYMRHYERETMSELDEPVRVAGASGIEMATHRALVHIDGLDIDVWAIVLENCPTLLSVGKLVKERGFAFVWEDFPILVSPDGQKWKCLIEADCPMVLPAGEVPNESGTTVRDNELGVINESEESPLRHAEGMVESADEPPLEVLTFSDRKSIFRKMPNKYGKVTQIIFFSDRAEKPLESKDVSQVRARTVLDRCMNRFVKGQGAQISGFQIYDEMSRLIRQVDIETPALTTEHIHVPGMRPGQTSKDSTQHILTHFPKCDTCEICLRSKPQKSPCRRRHDVAQGFSSWTEPAAFADLVTADHTDNDFKDIHGKMAARAGHRHAVVVQDYFSKFLEIYPVLTKSANETKIALQKFFGPDIKPKLFYSDGSGELISAAKELEFLHATSTPHRPQTNCISEGAVRRVKEGASALLVQSGFSES